VKGSLNVIADWLSRPPKSIALSESLLLEQNQTEEEDKIALEEALKKVHNARMGHVGARRTWRRLNKYFPGHQIAIKIVEDFVLVGFFQKLKNFHEFSLKLGQALSCNAEIEMYFIHRIWFTRLLQSRQEHHGVFWQEPSLCSFLWTLFSFHYFVRFPLYLLGTRT
jgi:hypothetical protein